MKKLLFMAVLFALPVLAIAQPILIDNCICCSPREHLTLEWACYNTSCVLQASTNLINLECNAPNPAYGVLSPTTCINSNSTASPASYPIYRVKYTNSSCSTSVSGWFRHPIDAARAANCGMEPDTETIGGCGDCATGSNSIRWNGNTIEVGCP